MRQLIQLDVKRGSLVVESLRVSAFHPLKRFSFPTWKSIARIRQWSYEKSVTDLFTKEKKGMNNLLTTTV